MSGHSKWSTIKHKKAANDAVKGNIFTKMAAGLTIAVKKGGGIGDPEMNFALRLAIDKAKSVNMPKENIDRAIERGTGKGDGQSLEELTLEGFGPEGIAVIAEAVTDNRNRTVAELRTLMEKHGGRMGEPGCVAYLFDRRGIVHYTGKIGEELELALIDAGAVDFESDENGGIVYTEPDSTHNVARQLQAGGLTEVEQVIGYRPKTTVVPTDTEKVEDFLELISDYDDVQEIYANVV